MPTFGFSAFLKLISLNPRPQRRELGNRFKPSKGGYDFHRSLRLRCRRLVLEGEPLEELLRSTHDIVKPAERNSTAEGLRRLATWIDLNSIKAIDLAPVVYESPKGSFKVSYSPDFGIRGQMPVAVHVWNTKRPELKPREIYAALSLVAPSVRKAHEGPVDLAVLSLRNSEIYRLSEAPDFSLVGRRIVENLENLISGIGGGGELPGDDRPSPPPPL